MNVTVLTWMRNEADMVPFFLRHYSFADRIIAWDNESTDDTRRLLESDPRVEVREWRTGGVMRDPELRDMKSGEYRATGEGWKIVVDADEFLWHPDVPGLLAAYDKVGITIPRVTGYDMVCDRMPVDDGSSRLTDLAKEGCRNEMYDKFCVFRECVDVRYDYGAHRLAYAGGRSVCAERADLKLLHYRYMSMERTMRRAAEYRQSPENVEGGMGWDNGDVRIQGARWVARWASRTKVI